MIRNAVWRSLDKQKLNYRFHNPNLLEVLEKELLQICMGANIKKIESAFRESVEKEDTLRVIAIERQAKVAKLKDITLFKMPKGEHWGKYYKISNEYI